MTNSEMPWPTTFDRADYHTHISATKIYVCPGSKCPGHGCTGVVLLDVEIQVELNSWRAERRMRGAGPA